jgi:hypothetical protein
VEELDRGSSLRREHWCGQNGIFDAAWCALCEEGEKGEINDEMECTVC